MIVMYFNKENSKLEYLKKLMTNFIDITIALSGVAQAAKLTKTLATTGDCDNEALLCSINSLLTINSENTLDVFGNELSGLHLGIDELFKQLSYDSKHKDHDSTRYIMNLLSLSKQLTNHSELNQLLGSRIQQVKAKAEVVGNDGVDDLYNSFADTYSSTVAKLKPRIRVTGKPEYLEVTRNQEKVRSILLAGIRSAFLWQQVGGKRRHFLFNRKNLLKATTELVNRLNHS